MRSRDTPLNGSSSRELTSREQSARQAYDLALARYDGGAVDFVTVLDSQRALSASDVRQGEQ